MKHRLNEAINCRNGGDVARSILVLEELLSERPSEFQVLYQLALGYKRVGDLDRAISFLNRCIDKNPEHEGTLSLLSFSLSEQGNVNEVSKLVHHVAKTTKKKDSILNHIAVLSDHLLRIREPNWRLQIKSALSGRRMEDPEDVLRELLRKKEAGHFSLLRFGDGEGAFLSGRQYEPSNEAYDVFRKEFFRIWFDREGNTAERDLVSHIIRSSLQAASCLGIPRFARLENAFKLGSWRGVITLSNLFESFFLEASDAVEVVCDSDINQKIVRRNFLPVLLAQFRRVVFITCHNNLPAETEKLVGSKLDYQIIPIPSEKRFLGNVDTVFNSGDHLRDFFFPICDKLESSSLVEEDTLFLIAAGGLGKYYGNLIFQKGGSVFDLGATADFIAGFRTRPIH